MTLAIKTKDNVHHKLEDSKPEIEIALAQKKRAYCSVKS